MPFLIVGRSVGRNSGFQFAPVSLWVIQVTGAGFASHGGSDCCPRCLPHADAPPCEPTAVTSDPTRSAAPRAMPCSGGEGTDQSHALPCGPLPVSGDPGKKAVRYVPSPAAARGNAGRRVPRGVARGSRREAGWGRDAGPSARGAGGACDHAARGRARSAARWRRRAEQWRPRPLERRVRCRGCCGAAGAAGLPRAVQPRPPPARDRPSPSGRSASLGARRGPQVSALSARGRSQTMGAAGGLLPSTRDPPGRAPAAPRDSRPCPCPRGVGSGRLAVDFGAVSPRVCAARTLPEEPAHGVHRFGSHAKEPADGLQPRELAESVGPSNSLSPSRAAASCPGVPGAGPGCSGGQSETSPSGILDADQGQPSPPVRAALLCLTSAKPIRTNSCCPNSDEPPV